MTFEEFISGRRETSDVSEAERYGDDKPDIIDAGLIYPTGLYISKVGSHWPQEAREQGEWYLLIANQEWIDDDLAFLERELWKNYKVELEEEPLKR